MTDDFLSLRLQQAHLAVLRRELTGHTDESGVHRYSTIPTDPHPWKGTLNMTSDLTPRLTAGRLLRYLQSAGISLRVQGDQLLASPRNLLGDADCAQIRKYKPELIELLTNTPDDTVVDALAERAYNDPPDFGDHVTALRESVLLRWPTGELLAWPPEAVAAWEAHSADVRAAADKAAHKK